MQNVIYWKQARALSWEKQVVPIEEKSFLTKLVAVLKDMAMGLGDGVVKVLVVLALAFLASMLLFR